MIAYQENKPPLRYALGASERYKYLKDFALRHVKEVMKRWASNPETEGDDVLVKTLLESDIRLYTIYGQMRSKVERIKNHNCTEVDDKFMSSCLDKVFDSYVYIIFED